MLSLSNTEAMAQSGITRAQEAPLEQQCLQIERTQQVISSSYLYLYLDMLSTQQVISSSYLYLYLDMLYQYNPTSNNQYSSSHLYLYLDRLYQYNPTSNNQYSSSHLYLNFQRRLVWGIGKLLLK
jgi:hypothetical protein